MTPTNRLAEVFDRGLRVGVESLSPEDRDLFRIQDFIIEFEMGGLSAYFYNRLPDLAGIKAAAKSMKRHGLIELAMLLTKAVRLFAKYSEPNSPTTWEDELRKYDPTDILGDLEQRITALDNYGLTS